MDPGLAKLISLPFFNADFGDLLGRFSLHTVEMIVGFGAVSADDFVSNLIAIAPALAPAGKDGKPLMADLKALADALDQLSILWSLVEATKDALLAREARLMGFGLAARAAPAPVAVRVGSSAQFLEPGRQGH